MEVVKAKDGNHYILRYKDSGFVHKEDEELWRCIRVDWNPKRDEWAINDDDDWMLNDDLEIIAREVGWDLRRFVPTDWGFDNYMKWNKK